MRNLDFGIQFFPDVGPEEKSATQYWDEALRLTGLCDELGFTSVRTVEHYFNRHGGYSTNPIVFLSAASQWTRKARLVTGAVLPVFDNMRSQNMVWSGALVEIRDMITALHEAAVGFEVASLLSNSWTLPADITEPSVRLFAEEVIEAEVELTMVAEGCRRVISSLLILGV